jgi:transcriptional regulator GlxA family with amidase domain
MTAHPEQGWTVARLARLGGVCEAHFARAFKRAFGVPPHRYLLSLRLERAKALLRDTDTPITDVALRCGWKSLGTFGRTFREVVGVTPTEWRSDAQRQPDGLGSMPACFVRASTRPDLKMSVSEKRRRRDDG